MNVVFAPSVPQGTVLSPPSKSMAHRLLFCAGLSDKTSVIGNLSDSDDIRATLRCFQTLGARIEKQGGDCRIRGVDLRSASTDAVLDCGECGSTLRFLLPLCMLSGNPFTLTGSERLLARPLSVYEVLCEQRKIEFRNNGRRVYVRGRLLGGGYEIPGDISSQFVSGLLFALPLLPEESEIRLTGVIESRPYIDMTCGVLQSAGIELDRPDGRTFRIRGGQRYKALQTQVEGDWSNAAYLFALNRLGYPVSVTGLQEDSPQGDRVCLSMLDALADGRPKLDISDCPDLGPVLLAAAAAQNGAVLTGTHRLCLKESDRGAAMAAELAKFGVECVVEADSIRVSGGICPPLSSVDSHNDHRIAMALSLLLILTGGVLTGAEAVKKSWPEFFECLVKLGVNLKYET